ENEGCVTYRTGLNLEPLTATYLLEGASTTGGHRDPLARQYGRPARNGWCDVPHRLDHQWNSRAADDRRRLGPRHLAAVETSANCWEEAEERVGGRNPRAGSVTLLHLPGAL